VSRAFSHLVAFDDAPFPRAWRGDVPVVGLVFAGERLDGVLRGAVRRDGADATRVLEGLVLGSRFASQLRLVLLEGIALAGFNVVDLAGLARATGCAVLVLSRDRPDPPAMRAALLGRVGGGARKWGLVERAGPMEPLAGLWAQRAGIGPDEATAVVRRTARHGRLPEPLRLAHLVASAFAVRRARRRRAAILPATSDEENGDA
jgi:hypothetical protein